MSTAPPIRYGPLAPRPKEGPVDLEQLVPGPGPLELDIGFGRGRSFLRRLEMAPNARVIGVEIKSKWATKVEAKRVRRGLSQGRVLCADARELLARSGPDGCLARVFVHFPDPWWKKRHSKRRVVTDALLDTLARLIMSGGELFIQTDVDDRADDYEALLEADERFEPAGERFRLDENPFGLLSNREVRADADGLPVYRLLARRV